MKKFFEKASKPFVLPTALKPVDPSVNNSKVPQSEHSKARSSSAARTSRSTAAAPHQHHPGLLPKNVLPPVPHPCPYGHLSLLPAKDGLLIRPHTGQDHQEQSLSQAAHVRISWGKDTKIEEIEATYDPAETDREGLDWKDAVVVYGIVGILELFSCAFKVFFIYLTSRAPAMSSGD